MYSYSVQDLSTYRVVDANHQKFAPELGEPFVVMRVTKVHLIDRIMYVQVPLYLLHLSPAEKI